MKLTVLGANGGTGSAVVRQAVAAGHDVTAVVRDAARMPADLREHVRVTVADGGPASADALADAVAGRDAVVNAIGTRDRKHPTGACADSTAALVRAARAAGGAGPRLVIASNSAMAPGAGDDPFTRFVVKPLILAPLLKHMLDDMRRAERTVRDSGLPWTVVRAGRLTDRPGKGRHRHRVDRNVPGGFQITRADFATALLDSATDPGRAGHVVSVGN
ncbi:NAD(P)-binding oxidoreductase [Streptomyces sp. RFCAC02]|uniref:NAD(P)-dependent oxidoreductase n=1 Tax=Streptomyces sp. RFCAC02 TaxID=2499143 RepID=UPI00101FA394|nr:NAD(P)-binding oxidoreductase [Streptomyces sp. RFCAC02]